MGGFGRVIGVAEFVQRLEQAAIRGVLASRITIAETAPAIIGRAIRGGVEIFVPQHEIGRDAVQHFAHVGRIDLHIDGAERGTVALDRVIQHRHFQPVIGQHRDLPARADALICQKLRKPVGQAPELTERDAARTLIAAFVVRLIYGDDKRLVATDFGMFAQHRRDAPVAVLIGGGGDVARCHGVF